MIWGFLVACSFICFLGKRTAEPILFFYYLILLMAIFFVTTKLVNEPYPLWILPMILIVMLVKNKFKLLYVFLTCIPVLFLAIHTPATDFFREYWFFSGNVKEFLTLNEIYVNVFLSLLSITFFTVLCLLIYRIVDVIAISSDWFLYKIVTHSLHIYFSFWSWVCKSDTVPGRRKENILNWTLVR